MSKSSKIIIVLLILILVAVLGVGGYIIFYKDNKPQNNETNTNENKQNIINNAELSNSNINELDNKTQISNTSSNTSVNNNNTSIPNDIYKINISNEDRFRALYYSKDFNRIDNLTEKDMIETVGVAISKGYVNIQGTKINENGVGGYERLSYTVADIRSAVYAIFGVEIKENISTASIIYEDNKYILNPADGDMEPSTVVILESDVAAGTAYYTYELYGEQAITDGEQKIGTYVVGINGNMVTSKEKK